MAGIKRNKETRPPTVGCYRIWGKTDRKRHILEKTLKKLMIENESDGQGQGKRKVLTMLSNSRKRWKK